MGAELSEFVKAGRLSETVPAEQTVTFLLYDEITSTTAVRVVADAINDRAGELESYLLAMRERAFEELGYRRLVADATTGRRDTRVGAVVRYRKGEFSPLSEADLLADLDAMRILAVVAEEVDRAFEHARRLYVRGWTDWEFFTLATRDAGIALETSLRLLFEDWLGSNPVEVSGVNHAGVHLTRSTPATWRAVRGAAKGLRGAHVNGARVPRSKVELLRHATAAGLLSEWEGKRAHALFVVRDVLAHDSHSLLMWISEARGLIVEAAVLINLMWARRGARDFARETGYDDSEEP